MLAGPCSFKNNYITELKISLFLALIYSYQSNQRYAKSSDDFFIVKMQKYSAEDHSFHILFIFKVNECLGHSKH